MKVGLVKGTERFQYVSLIMECRQLGSVIIILSFHFRAFCVMSAVEFRSKIMRSDANKGPQQNLFKFIVIISTIAPGGLYLLSSIYLFKIAYLKVLIGYKLQLL